MATKVIQNLALGANAKSSNQMTDHADEYLRGDSKLDFYGMADGNGVLVTLLVGERALLEDEAIHNDTPPIDVSKHQIAMDVGAAGEKIKLTFRDTSGAARVVDAMLVITPV